MWNSEPHLLLWLIFNFEMLVMGPQENKKAETINKAVSRSLDLFKVGHIEELWRESRRVKSRRQCQHQSNKADNPDKAVQDAAEEDNWRTAHVRAVKRQVIAPITSTNRPIVTSKYPKRICRGWSQAARSIKNTATLTPSAAYPHILLQLPRCIIPSIPYQNTLICPSA